MATISTNHTSVGSSSELSVVKNDKVTYALTGTWVGSMFLEKSSNGGKTWDRVLSSTANTSGTFVNDQTKSVSLRWRCNVYTSGTVASEIADAAIVVNQIGSTLEVTDGGINVIGAITDDGVAVPTISSTSTLTNKTITAPVLGGSATGTYTLAGTPTITAPVLGGSVTGTYTLAGTPTITSPAITTPTITGPVTSTAAASDATLGTVNAPVSGTTAVTIDRFGPFFRLNFTLTAAQIPVTDGAGAGSHGALKLFDFAEQGLAIIGCRQNYTAYAEGAALTGGAGDAVFEIGVGTVAIAAAADGTLGATNDNVGVDIDQTLSGGTTTGTVHTFSSLVADGTATASDLYLNWSGTAATIDANSTIDVTGTITVVGVMLGDD